MNDLSREPYEISVWKDEDAVWVNENNISNNYTVSPVISQETSWGDINYDFERRKDENGGTHMGITKSDIKTHENTEKQWHNLKYYAESPSTAIKQSGSQIGLRFSNINFEKKMYKLVFNESGWRSAYPSAYSLERTFWTLFCPNVYYDNTDLRSGYISLAVKTDLRNTFEKYYGGYSQSPPYNEAYLKEVCSIIWLDPTDSNDVAWLWNNISSLVEFTWDVSDFEELLMDYYSNTGRGVPLVAKIHNDVRFWYGTEGDTSFYMNPSEYKKMTKITIDPDIFCSFFLIHNDYRGTDINTIGVDFTGTISNTSDARERLGECLEYISYEEVHIKDINCFYPITTDYPPYYTLKHFYPSRYLNSGLWNDQDGSVGGNSGEFLHKARLTKLGGCQLKDANNISMGTVKNGQTIDIYYFATEVPSSVEEGSSINFRFYFDTLPQMSDGYCPQKVDFEFLNQRENNLIDDWSNICYINTGDQDLINEICNYTSTGYGAIKPINNIDFSFYVWNDETREYSVKSLKNHSSIFSVPFFNISGGYSLSLKYPFNNGADNGQIVPQNTCYPLLSGLNDGNEDSQQNSKWKNYESFFIFSEDEIHEERYDLRPFYIELLCGDTDWKLSFDLTIAIKEKGLPAYSFIYEENLTFDGLLTFNYLKEKKIAVIGSSEHSKKNYTQNPVLNQSISGITTLNFSLYKKYWDDTEQDFIDNPFVDLLVNETKIKLKKGNEWFDFLIKNREDSLDEKQYSFTCKDYHASILGKQGFNIELSQELYNNQGTIEELTDKVLESSDWVQGNTETLYEKQEETLFSKQLSAPIEIYDKNRVLQCTATQPQLCNLFFFYSDVANAEENSLVPCYFEVISETSGSGICPQQVPFNELARDGNQVIDDWDNICYIEAPNLDDAEITNYRAKKHVTSNISEYNPKIKKYIQKYTKDDEEYGCFTETEYIASDLVPELSVNGGMENETEGITAEEGWELEKTDLAPSLFFSDFTDPTVAPGDYFEYLDDNATIKMAAKGYIRYHNNTGNTHYLMNTGLIANKEIVNNFTSGDRYICEIIYGIGHASWNQASPQTPQICEIKYTDSGWDFVETIATGNEIDSISDSDLVKRDYWRVSEKPWLFAQTYELEINETISEKDFKTKNFGIILPVSSSGDIKIAGFSFYKKNICSLDDETDTNKKNMIAPNYTLRLNPSEWRLSPNDSDDSIVPKGWSEYISNTSPTERTKTKYNVYKIEDNEDIESIEEIQYIYQGYETPESQDYIPQTTEEKIRNLEASNSNIFNILQSLAEVFQCWCKFTVEHEENGEIALTTPPVRQQKSISFHNLIGDKNDLGFKYGINVTNIQRTLESDSLVTKMIVPMNVTEFAKNGFCTISRARDNVGKNDTIYNLEYYFQMGLLSSVNRQKLLSYLKRSGELYSASQKYSEKLTAVLNNKDKAQADIDLWTQMIDETNKELANKAQDFNATYNVTISWLLTHKTQSYWASKGILATDNNGNNYYFLEEPKNDLDDYFTLKSKIGISDNQNYTGYYLEKNIAEQNYNNAKKLEKSYTEQLETLTNQQKDLYDEFVQHLGPYLQEGTWSSSNYIDDNLYYLDARQVLASSAKPQVSYEINALNLVGLEGYESYSYKIGDRATIEDPDFFGWVLIQEGNTYTQTPYKERIVVTEILTNLDDPSQNTITVQNYKSQFEDLFQKMSAETQNLQYKEGSYDNASTAVGPNGQILPDAITNTFNNSSFVISNTSAQNLVWDNNGITITSATYPSKKVRLNGDGLLVSSDGGATWSTAITGGGINASTITTGTLNADNVNIKNGNNNAFVWNKNGLVAYLYDNNQLNVNNKITLNQYGLFGGLSDGVNLSSDFLNQLEQIHADSRFALTWKGFSLKTGHHNDTGYVSIDSDNDFTVNVLPYTNSENYQKIIQIGHLVQDQSSASSDSSESSESSDSTSTEHYGICIKDLDGNTIFTATEEGLLEGNFQINCGEWE